MNKNLIEVLQLQEKLYSRKPAEDLNCRGFPIDTIREQMREIVRKEDYPNLFRMEMKALTDVDF